MAALLAAARRDAAVPGGWRWRLGPRMRALQLLPPLREAARRQRHHRACCWGVLCRWPVCLPQPAVTPPCRGVALAAGPPHAGAAALAAAAGGCAQAVASQGMLLGCV